MANQFVVELKNEPGGLATLAEALAARGIDLRAIGGGGIGASGHIIMTTAAGDLCRSDGRGELLIQISVVEKERTPSFEERRCVQVPLLEKRREGSAVDRQSDLV